VWVEWSLPAADQMALAPALGPIGSPAGRAGGQFTADELETGCGERWSSRMR
jgi:hypothetical protein